MNIRTTALILSFIVVPTLFTGYSQGQRTYLMQCKQCHGNGTKGAALKQQNEWEVLFADKAALLKELHEATEATAYFRGTYFQKAAPGLHDFLYYYASDSGNVPICY